MKPQFVNKLNKIFNNLFQNNILSVAYPEFGLPHLLESPESVEFSESLKANIISNKKTKLTENNFSKISFQKPAFRLPTQSILLNEIYKKSLIHVPKITYKIKNNISLIKDIENGQYRPLSPVESSNGQYQPLPSVESSNGQYRPLSPVESSNGQYQPLPSVESSNGQYQPLPNLKDNDLNKETSSKINQDSISISPSNMSKIRINNQDYFVPNQKQKINIFKFMANKPAYVMRKLNEKGTMLIPAYERGTNRPITSPTLAMVGERGPEQIVPNQSISRVPPVNNRQKSFSTPDSEILLDGGIRYRAHSNVPSSAGMFELGGTSYPIFDGEI